MMSANAHPQGKEIALQNHSTLIRLAGVALALTLGTVLTAAAPSAAQAAPDTAAGAQLVPNLIRVSNVSASTSVNKSVSVPCPLGLVVYGAGGEITGGVGNVVLDAVIPTETTVIARGAENGAYSQNWTVTVYAVCGSRTANYQIVSITGPADATPSKTNPANCPAATLNALGLGFRINGATGLIFPDLLLANGQRAQVRATRDADSTSTAVWSITTYAVCASPPSGLERVSEASAVNSTSPKTVTPTCSTGKLAHSVGAEHTARGNAIIDDLTPNSTLTGAIVTVYENPPDFAANWQLTGHAVCAF